MFKHELGKEAKDVITGISGILIGRCEHMFGCNTYGIAPKAAEGQKRPDTEWFDEGRIEIIGTGISPESVQVDKPGCDYRDHP